MKNVYLKPVVAEYGNSLNLINGSCGWGTENVWLDKTGAYNTTRTEWVLVSRVTLLAGPYYDTYQCQSVSACSTQSNQC